MIHGMSPLPKIRGGRRWVLNCSNSTGLVFSEVLGKLYQPGDPGTFLRISFYIRT